MSKNNNQYAKLARTFLVLGGIVTKESFSCDEIATDTQLSREQVVEIILENNIGQYYDFDHCWQGYPFIIRSPIDLKPIQALYEEISAIVLVPETFKKLVRYNLLAKPVFDEEHLEISCKLIEETLDEVEKNGANPPEDVLQTAENYLSFFIRCTKPLIIYRPNSQISKKIEMLIVVYQVRLEKIRASKK